MESNGGEWRASYDGIATGGHCCCKVNGIRRLHKFGGLGHVPPSAGGLHKDAVLVQKRSMQPHWVRADSRSDGRLLWGCLKRRPKLVDECNRDVTPTPKIVRKVYMVSGVGGTSYFFCNSAGQLTTIVIVRVSSLMVLLTRTRPSCIKS